LFLILLVVFSMNSATDYIKDIELYDGFELKELMDAKVVNVLFTFKGTKIWNEPMEEFISSRGLDRDDMLKRLDKDFYSETKNRGKKWGIKQIKDVSEATEGYLFIVNIHSIIIIPMVGTQVNLHVSCYRANEPDKLLLKGQMRGMEDGMMKKKALQYAGEQCGEKIVSFFKKQIKR
ncbi:MAG: hypothetical protein MJB14_03630, partial [Spirochaetes bacterium]|nr:hypothetical protein [Spirochaetota bacterium]